MCPGDDGSDGGLFDLFSSQQDIEQQFRSLDQEKEMQEKKEEEEELKKRSRHLTGEAQSYLDAFDDDIINRAIEDGNLYKSTDEDKCESKITEDDQSSIPDTQPRPRSQIPPSQNGEANYKSKLKLKISKDHASYEAAKKGNVSDSDKNKYLNPSEWVGLGIVIKKINDNEYQIIEVASGGVGETLNFCEGDKLSLNQDTDIFDLTKDLREGKFDKVAFLKDASGNNKIHFDQDTKNTFKATFEFGGARTFIKNDEQKTVLKGGDELDIDSNIKDANANYGFEREFVIREQQGKFVFKGNFNKIRQGNDLIGYSLSCQQTKSKEAISKDLSIGKIDEYSFKDSAGNDKTNEVKNYYKKNCINHLILNISNEKYGLKNKDEIKIDKKEFLDFLNNQDNKEYLPLLISNYQNDKEIKLEGEKFKINGEEVQFNSEALLKFVGFQIRCGSLSLFSKIGKYSKENDRDLSINNLETNIKKPSVAISPLGADPVSAGLGLGRGIDVSAALA